MPFWVPWGVLVGCWVAELLSEVLPSVTLLCFGNLLKPLPSSDESPWWLVFRFVLLCWDWTLGGRQVVASKPDLVGSRGSQLLVSDLVADCWVQIFVGVLSSS